MSYEKKDSEGCPFFRVSLLRARIRRTARLASHCLLTAALAWSVQAIGQPFPEAASERGRTARLIAGRYAVTAAHPLAAAAGQSVLEAGGSAVDAAIATVLVLNVVEPQSSGIGGGGFLLHHGARTRALRLFDGRETAPRDIDESLFLDAGGKPLGFFDAVVGGRAVGVPGLVPMLEQAHRTLGRRPWASLFDPAIALAEGGFPVSPRLHALIARDRFLGTDPGARQVFFDATGEPLRQGATMRNPELARTLRAIAARGATALLSGPIADDIVAAVQGHARNPGRLERADLEAYRPLERAPLCGWYREWRVCGAPPPSSGGVVTLQILKLLESRDIAALAPDGLMAAHLFSEAGRLAYADRATYLADPAFASVPVRALLAPAYLAARADRIEARRSVGTALPGALPAFPRAHADSSEIAATTHLSIVDAEGNAVALTASIENAFGARLMARGVLLNNQLTDFSFAPRQAGLPVANRPQGGKRPLSSMAPTMVFDRNGRLELVIGSPGGPFIPNLVARTLIAALDWRLDLASAIALPHYGSRNGPTELERGPHADALRRSLELLGHDVRVFDMPSGLHGMQRVAGGWLVAADPRREGVALGR